MKIDWEILEFEKSIVKINYTNKIKRKDFLEKGLYPIISQEKELINGFWNNINELFKINQPVVIFGDHTKVIKYIDFDFVLGADGVKIIQPIEAIFPKYIYYFLLNTKLKNLGYARHYRLLKETKIYYPKSLKEQKRIVKIIDKVFAAIGKTKENIENNLKNSKELFESYLSRIFENQGSDWEMKKLVEVCKVIAGQSPEGKYYNKNGKGTPFYQGKKEFTSKNIGIPTTWTTKVTKEALPGDILMSVRAPVGPVNFTTEKICIGRGLSAIRETRFIDKDYLFYYLLKHENEIIGNEGAVFNSINKTQIENLKIPIPPLPEQKQIVVKLNTFSIERKHLESIYQKIIADLQELKKSFLKKAFEGEL